jgi:F0F1-type ATP synthase membrane subunit b/b'
VIQLDAGSRDALIEVARTHRLYVEGNILKVIDAGGDAAFAAYLKDAIEQDKTTRRRRLDVTKQVQAQNKGLTEAQGANTSLMSELQGAVTKAEEARQAADAARKEADAARVVAEGDLDLIQKRTQFELVGSIVRVALQIIVGVGVTTTALYAMALFQGLDTTLLGSTWSNMFSILLTNSFSIIGTIMGVKYASAKSDG